MAIGHPYRQQHIFCALILFSSALSLWLFPKNIYSWYLISLSLELAVATTRVPPTVGISNYCRNRIYCSLCGRWIEKSKLKDSGNCCPHCGNKKLRMRPRGYKAKQRYYQYMMMLHYRYLEEQEDDSNRDFVPLP
jgi:DNA-directed RNA polymerase subunit RPC12/RpoP